MAAEHRQVDSLSRSAGLFQAVQAKVTLNDARRTARTVALFACLLLTASATSAQPVATEIPGVTAELLELRTSGGALRLAVRFVNTTAAPTAPVEIKVADIALIDSKALTKTFGFTDGAGRYVAGPITDWSQGGRWLPKLPPKGEAIFWMYFRSAAAGAVLTVQMPKTPPFENVKVTEGAGTVTSSQTAVSTPSGFTASLVSAQREGQELRVQIRFEPSADSSGRAPDPEVVLADVFAFDPAGRRKFMLTKDAAGNVLAQVSTRQIAMSLTAPPPDVTAVDIIIPGFVPFEGVKLGSSPAK